MIFYFFLEFWLVRNKGCLLADCISDTGWNFQSRKRFNDWQIVEDVLSSFFFGLCVCLQKMQIVGLEASKEDIQWWLAKAAKEYNIHRKALATTGCNNRVLSMNSCGHGNQSGRLLVH